MVIRYRDAGVDIQAGDAFAAGLAGLARRATRPEVLAGIGGFAGLFRPELGGMTEPVLVSGTDGVGTKLLVAQRAGRHDTIGVDLVAMCVNDVVTTGAEPLFFLDYYATGRLEPGVGREVLSGIVRGCELAGCALLGGETAEMPGMFPPGKYDLAGFCVGLVDRPKIIDGSAVRAGDVVIGVASDGLHSNGFSLVRHALFERAGLSLEDRPEPLGTSLAEELLRPTRIYARAVRALVQAHLPLHALAHITGGGIAGNLVRVLPEGVCAELDRQAWREPPIFGLLRALDVPADEMDHTFNLGLGLGCVCPERVAESVVATLRAAGETCAVIGHIRDGDRAVHIEGAPTS